VSYAKPLLAILFALASSDALLGDELRVSAMDLSSITQGWGDPGINTSVGKKPLTIAGTTFPFGVGTHAVSTLNLDLKGGASRFTSQVGVDDETDGQGSIEFKLIGDSRELWTSGLMKGKEKAKPVDVDLTGVRKLTMLVTDGGDGVIADHADWAMAAIRYSGAKPEPLVIDEPAVILTPKAPPQPRINGAKVVGVRPGNPFLFAIPATGTRPMTYHATGLPTGLILDSATGIITGSTAATGRHDVTVTVSNSLGMASRTLRIMVGDMLALTPPMGWNSWNCFANTVTEHHVLDAADDLVKSGLRDHGWTYINIDDCWMPKNSDPDATMHGPERDAAGKINSNPRFPDMKRMTDHIHALGLKAGIYSSPGPTTCGECVASYKHEKQDAERWAEWGFDYLKYDWCSYSQVEKGSGRDYFKKPYALMGGMLKAQKRDIVFSLCQYGMENVGEWGASVNGNSWRTTLDIYDNWGKLLSIGFNQAEFAQFTGPGHWNDPDMLVVGWVGWGSNLHPTHLTPNEQYSHVSLWCLLSAPLLLGCDLAKLDDFTLNLLTNDEVLAVNQDPLGHGAHRVLKRADQEIYTKLLEDGSLAIGLFNLYEDEETVSIHWSDLGLTGSQQVRDLWRQHDLGLLPDGLSARVPRHGCVLVTVTPSRK